MSFLLLCIFLIIAVFGYHELNVTSDLILDDHAGRHSKIVIGSDNLPFIIYVSDIYTKGAIGVVHCEDIYCNNKTKHYIDVNATTGETYETEQTAMKLSPATNYPQIAYTLHLESIPDIHIRFITCSNHNCTQYILQDIFDFTNNGDNAYIDFIYNDDNYPLISYNADPYGLYLISCTDITCTKNGINGPYIIDNNYNTTNGGTGWYNSLTLYKDNLFFMYYCNISFTINYAFFNYKTNEFGFNNEILNVSHKILKENVHGAWLVVTYQNLKAQQQLSLFYIDLTSSRFMYSNCTINNGDLNDGMSCDSCVIDTDKQINDDWTLWSYPDITIQATFNTYPVISYFDMDSLKFAQCNSLQCDKANVEQLASGLSGFGRDTSIVWFHNILYIAFLDYNGDGQDKKARLLLCDTTSL